MNIAIIVGGRFHAFNLAEQLNKNNNLKQIITSYPKLYLKNKFNIENDKVNSILLKEIVSRSFLSKFFDTNNFLTEYFDKKASDLVNYKNLDILIGWSSFSLKSFYKAKNYKCIKILERGSTHIEHQKEILEEEYRLHDMKPVLPSTKIIEKEKLEYEIADYITVPTEFAKKTFINKGFDEKKIIKIPYGVDINHFKNTDLKSSIDKKKKFRIIYTGACSIRKGIIYLLKAFCELNLEDAELMIIGNIDNDIKPKIKKYFYNNKIKFIKSQKQSDLKKFYNYSDVFVTCSIEEGLSMVQLQAMSCGLPIICTPNSGGEEIVDDKVNGFILPIRNIEKLKNKIMFLYNDPARCKEMGKSAKYKASTHFSWDLYGKNVIETYQNLIRKR